MKRFLFILLIPISVAGGERMIEYPNELTLSPPKVSAFGAVQTSTQVTGNGASPLAITLSATTQGNLVVVHVYMRTGHTNTVTSVTDNAGNTYVIGAKFTAQRSVYQAYGMQITGGATSVSVAFSSTGTYHVGADEYSGFVAGATNTDVFDERSTGTEVGTDGAVEVSPALTPDTGELIVATVGNTTEGATWTAGSGYTLYNGSSNRLQSEYKLSSSTSETAPITESDTGAGLDEIAQAYKAGAVAAKYRFFFKP